jgi:hypothetical protein
VRKAEAGTAWAGQIGMRAYSTDLKERLVRAVANGLLMQACYVISTVFWNRL